MNFAFSDEQLELGRIVRQFLEDKSGEPEVRRLMDTEQGYDPAVWRQMAEQMGLQGLIVPEEHGGAGYSFLELVVVLEQMGAALLCAPYFSTVVLGVSTLLHAGDDAARKEWLPGIAAGDTVATLALTEDNGRWDAEGVQLEVRRDGERWTLHGHKSYVLDGHVADLVLVAARTEGGVTLFAVPGDAPGLARTVLSTMDQTRKLARLEFDAVPARLVGQEGGGWQVVERVLDLAAVALAAEQVGGAQRCLDLSVAYAKERIQFGRPIGSFQAVKHRCADMLVAVEQAKSAAYYAGWCAAELDADLPVAAAMAKAYCSEAYFKAAADTIQIHGGIGFTWEHPAHLYFKRAKSSELLFGDPAHHRELLAQRLGI
ncbi:MAG TPA: acyl-CoA dehydrogenase family protein [Egibacteraceae bacterium]|nr:acyl-CoA dehydrogenase family protein [Egibacteraceae bacterium]